MLRFAILAWALLAAMHSACQSYPPGPQSSFPQEEEEARQWVTGCEGALYLNPGIPDGYPGIFEDPADAAERFGAEMELLRKTYEISTEDYQIQPVPVTWSAHVTWQLHDFPRRDILLDGEEVDEHTSPSLALEFLSDWSGLFQIQGPIVVDGDVICSRLSCTVRLAQDYCGLRVETTERHVQEYGGGVEVSINRADASLTRSISSFVPAVATPSNPILTRAEIEYLLVGQKLEMVYFSGEARYTHVAAESTFEFEPDLRLFVQPSDPEIRPGLAYRLAYSLLVVPEPEGCSWTVLVDAIDGTVLDRRPHCIS